MRFDILCRAPKKIVGIGPIGQQTAGFGKKTIRIDRGQSVFGGLCNDRGAMADGDGVRDHQQTAIRLARESFDRMLDIGADAVHIGFDEFQANCWRGGLDRIAVESRIRVLGVRDDRGAAHARRDLLQQLQPFRPDGVFEIGKAGNIASRPSQTFDEARPYGIRNVDEDDRYGVRFLPHSCYDGRGRGQEDIGCQGNELLCRGSRALRALDVPTIIDFRCFAPPPTRAPEGLAERR